MNITIVTTLENVLDGDLKRQWHSLYEQCPWATVLQSWAYVAIWYESYRHGFTPAVVVGRNANNEVVGILPLAVSRQTGHIEVAGSNRAEYQGWLSTGSEGDVFIQDALHLLNLHFPNQQLQFLFLPDGVPLHWIHDSEWKNRCELREHSRALLRIGDGSSFLHSLKKKSNKSRLNRLERLGPVKFELITDRAALASIVDDLLAYKRLRWERFNYPQDPYKKDFYLAMMDAPRLVHATVLRAGEHIAAAHIGLYNRQTVVLGSMIHSPFLAQHSPGKLLLLMLGVELAKQGIPIFDLTPGGEYKERFATHHDHVHALTVFFKRTAYLKHKAKRAVINSGKRVLEYAGLSRNQVFETVHAARALLKRIPFSSIPSRLFIAVKKTIRCLKELRIYSMDVEQIRTLPNPMLMKRDCLRDLLAYQPAEAWQSSARAFLSQAPAPLEQGNHFYTRVEDDKLIYVGWLIKRQNRSPLTDVGQDFYPLPDSALLFDYYSHPERGKDSYGACLYQMLHDAACIPNTKRVYIAVPADNSPSRHVVEEAGFTDQYSFFKEVRLGKTKRWTTAPPVVTRPQPGTNATQ